MIVIIGLPILFVAMVVGIVGVLSNAGAAHPRSTGTDTGSAMNSGQDTSPKEALTGRKQVRLPVQWSRRRRLVATGRRDTTR
jgi:hypothetical protein